MTALWALILLAHRTLAEFSLGALTAGLYYPDSFLAIIAAHFDFRKHFEPALRGRYTNEAYGSELYEVTKELARESGQPERIQGTWVAVAVVVWRSLTHAV
eukprot:Skav212963  [mRNA]  locus=scaffold1345:14211:16217:+ [translate_table: standard]